MMVLYEPILVVLIEVIHALPNRATSPILISSIRSEINEQVEEGSGRKGFRAKPCRGAPVHPRSFNFEKIKIKYRGGVSFLR